MYALLIFRLPRAKYEFLHCLPYIFLNFRSESLVLKLPALLYIYSAVLKCIPPLTSIN